MHWPLIPPAAFTNLAQAHHASVIGQREDAAAMVPKIDLVYFNAGGGHRAAALALEAAIQHQGWPWQVRRVNLTEVLDPGGRFRRATGIDPEDLYNFRLARGWTLGLAQELRLLQGAIRMVHAPMTRRLVQHWATAAPDLVVSLIPNFNRALYDSLAQARPGVPYVTVLTDLADLPPHFWIERGQRQHLVCGTDAAVKQAEQAGYESDHIWRVSGMLLRQAFHADTAFDKAALRTQLGLAADRPTAVVMFGGYGSAQMLAIARALPDLQLVLMCGRNARLAGQLRKLPTSGVDQAARVVVEFTEDVPRFMGAADFFIGKPGPGCLSEALQLGLPVVTFGNAFTMPQERFNVRWVCEQGVGLAVRRTSELPAAAARLLADLPRFAACVASHRSHASVEVPYVLAQLLEGTAKAQAHQPGAERSQDIDGPRPQWPLHPPYGPRPIGHPVQALET